MLQVTVPGKLIVSGEHAVVYGCPALAAAIDRYIQVRLAPLPDPIIEFAVLEYQAPLVSLSMADFWEQVEQIERRYDAFLREELAVTDITTHLYDLPLYAVGLFLRRAGIQCPEGLRITISGDLPMGYGLGSSAAVIVGVLRILSLYFQVSLQPEELKTLAIQVENMQHGHSSGLDISVCLYQGIILYSQSSLVIPALKPWSAYLVNTGQPLSSTGECVAYVKKHITSTHSWEPFAEVTHRCLEALEKEDESAFRLAIKENQRLLTQLGVVPEKIQRFIEEIMEQGGIAKICGAGSVSGDNAGYLLLLPGEHLASIENVVHAYGFTLEHVQLGVYPLDDFFSALKGANVPRDFLSKKEREKSVQNSDPFSGWKE
jgi:mevalonate kinase